MTKAELRRLYLEKRSTLPLTESARLSRDIAERFFDTVSLEGVNIVSTFIRIAKFNEIDTSVIYYRIWRDMTQIRTVAPVIDVDANVIKSVEFTAHSELAETRWGLREPVGKVVPSHDVDVVVVPLLCFDEAGHRVGYGKGFYDRFLAQVRPDCLKVGLSYFAPVDEISDAGDHDVTLDICITPLAVTRFSQQEYL